MHNSETSSCLSPCTWKSSVIMCSQILQGLPCKLTPLTSRFLTFFWQLSSPLLLNVTTPQQMTLTHHIHNWLDANPCSKFFRSSRISLKVTPLIQQIISIFLQCSLCGVFSFDWHTTSLSFLMLTWLRAVVEALFPSTSYYGDSAWFRTTTSIQHFTKIAKSVHHIKITTSKHHYTNSCYLTTCAHSR